MICSVCIATYKRPELLKILIKSLFSQNISEDIIIEIIIVDNDVDKTGEKICAIFNDKNNVKLNYLTQPIQNISLTRNKAVHAASGEYLLFIDDDGYPENNWISELLTTLKKFDADGVFGTVIPYFEEGVPEWIKNSHFFERLIQKTGEQSIFTRTGNCLVKSQLVKSIDGPFDPEYGLSGGEDGILFGKLRAKGAKFIFCAEAIVHDFVPLERGNIRWLAKRSFRIGITYTKRIISYSNHKIFKRVYLLIKALIYAFISILLFIIFSPIKLWRNHWYLKIISNIGHIAGIFNINYQIYKA